MALKFMLAKEYTIDMKAPRNTKDYNPPIKWLMSEKLDGYRARFNPETKTFVSRQNKPYNAPKWFTNFLPKIHLDGELFAGRDHFQSMGVVRKKVPVDTEWYNIKYYVYDIPENDPIDVDDSDSDIDDSDKTFIERYERLEIIVKEAQNIWSLIQDMNQEFKDVSCPIVLCKHHVVESMEHMKSFYKSVLDKGGEGIMLKDPDSMYEDKRSNYLLKYKPSFDMEAVIVGYKDGTGKYKGKLGSFICKPLINKEDHQILDEVKEHEFATSGMDDSVRENYKNTHPIGTIITIQNSGFTNSGKPRFARYLRIRDDVVLKEDKQKNMEGDKTAKLCVHIFERIAVYEKANSEPFKAKAYTTASKALKDMNDCDLTPETLLKVKGIGKSILEKIMTIIQTGTLEQYENIKDFKDPKEIFMSIHGIGTVKAKELVSRGFTNVEEVKKCENIKDYLNDVQMKGLKWYNDMQHRIPYCEITEHEIYLKKVLYNIDPSAELTIAGSYRRKKETSGDIDMLINTPSIKNNSVYNAFMDELFKQGYLLEELSRGPKKFMGICKLGIESLGRRIDIMYTKPQEYPFAILYFTGSMEFNVKMRGELLEKGLSLNEYGIKSDKKNVKHGCKTEKDVFEYLGYDYVEPEDR
jgi:DNA polymerase/3'-5' exonuclease PolX